MKLLTTFKFATALFLATALLIAAFIILFSYSSQSSNVGSNENAPDKTSLVTESAAK
jgi:hypothetical protein